MGIYRQGTNFTIREGKLTIFQKDKKYKTDNWYGRFFIESKQVEKSSKSKNKKESIKVLGQIYDDYFSKKRLGLVVHSKSFKDCWKEFCDDIKQGTQSITQSGYIQKGKILSEIMGNLKVDRLTYDDLGDYLVKRMEGSFKGNRSRSVQQETLRGDLRVFSIFDSWLVNKGYKKKKLSKLQKNLRKYLGKKEDTSRLYFNRGEYQTLLNVSKKRIKECEDRTGNSEGKGYNYKRVLYQRKLLHQFIIFGVNTGIRVGGILNLKWEDVQMRDKRDDYMSKGIEKNYGKDFFNSLDRYYTINNVKDKTGVHTNIGLGGSYFSLQKIKELKQQYGKSVGKSDKIFDVKSFSDGFNKLLEESNLKTVKSGDRFLRRDSVSLRHTYIVFQIQNNISEFIIGKNVGTSGKMIYEHYTKHLKSIELVEKLTGVNKGRHLRLVSVK